MSVTTTAVLDRIEIVESSAPPRRTTAWGPLIVAVVAAAIVGVSGLRGADYPAHFVRALTWERAGPSVWSNLWYGGHSTVSYSVLSPLAMALVGPFAVVALGSIVSTYVFARLANDLYPGSTTGLANYAFALAMSVNVVVGRAPFALGLAAALLALRALQRHRMVPAVVAAVLASLFSPVAGAFLAIAAASVALVGRHDARSSLRAAALVAGALCPLGVVTVLFGGTGWFPFRGGHFAVCVLVLSLVWLIVRVRVVRCGAVVAAVVAVATFVIPNPLGGNYVRLVQIVAVPIAVAALASVRRSLLAPCALAVAGALMWSLYPAVVAAADWWGDDSVDAAYHAPLVEEVRRRNTDGRPLGRLEIPFTVNHWESLFVGTQVPFARGWERQVDLAHNAALYDAGLSIDEYRAWLHDNGVRWVALADTDIDHAGISEQQVVERHAGRDQRLLRLVWSNPDWRLYEVVGYTPIVESPAELVEQGVDWLRLRTSTPATVTVRYHDSPYLTIDGGACLAVDESGWVVAHLPAAGEYRLSVDPAEAWLGSADDRCADGSNV